MAMPPGPDDPRRRLTTEDIDRVAGIADPVIRNLMITQAYHDLSASAAKRLGQVANWCTFATWASKQAGRTIRKEDLRRALEAEFRSSPDAASAANQVTTEARRFGAKVPVGASPASIWAIVDPMAALDRASAAVARGNLRVFEEVGLEFARFDVESGEARCPRAGRPRDVPRATHARVSRRTGRGICARRSRTTTGHAIEGDPATRAPSSSCSPTWRSASTSRSGSNPTSRRRSTAADRGSTRRTGTAHRGPVSGRRLASFHFRLFMARLIGRRTSRLDAAIECGGRRGAAADAPHS